jgi:radical SAM protein with 4Fe4S-binding SPASM domain
LALLSNGSLLDQKTLDKLFKKYKFDTIQISLEGMEKNNDAIRGKGSFKKASEALERISKMKKKATISMTLTRQNMADLPQILNLGHKLGASVGVRRLVLEGSGKDLKKSFLSAPELFKIYDFLNEAALRLQPKIFVAVGCEAGFLAQRDSKNLRYSFCTAMTPAVLTPLPDGKVLSCRRLPIEIGDLKKERLLDIYGRLERKEASLKLEKMPGACRECENFSDCLGGSRCVSFSYFGKKDLYSPDPQCLKLAKTK